MSKPRSILSTCGTSLLTFQAEPATRQAIIRASNVLAPSEVEYTERQLIENQLRRARTAWLEVDWPEAAKQSAEINALFHFYQRQMQGHTDQHWLLGTDTWLGKATVSLLEEKLQAAGMGAENIHIGGLRPDHIESFQLALSDLVLWCEETMSPMKQSHDVIFNLTGGFKSIQGFLQSLANLYADEVIYIFESRTDLMRLPKLPVRLDAEPIVQEHLNVFRRLAKTLPVKAPTPGSSIPELFLMSVDDQVCLSAWGQLVWHQTYKTLYQTQLWPAPSPKIRFADGLKKSIEQELMHQPDKLQQINQRMDDFACCLEKGEHIQSLGFTDLVMKKHYTHEIYAWSDRGAKRLFGRFDGDVFVVEKLGPHL